MLMTRPRNVDNVSVSYEEGNQRIVKRFTDPILARRFFAVKSREGKSPKVHRAAEVSTMSVENTNVAVVETTEAAPVVVAKKKPTPRKAPAAKKPTPKPAPATAKTAPAPKGKKEEATPKKASGKETIRTRLFKLLAKHTDGLSGRTVMEKLGLSGVPAILKDEGICEKPRIRRLVSEEARGVVYVLTALGKKDLEAGKVDDNAAPASKGQAWPEKR